MGELSIKQRGESIKYLLYLLMNIDEKYYECEEDIDWQNLDRRTSNRLTKGVQEEAIEIIKDRKRENAKFAEDIMELGELEEVHHALYNSHYDYDIVDLLILTGKSIFKENYYDDMLSFNKEK